MYVVNKAIVISNKNYTNRLHFTILPEGKSVSSLSNTFVSSSATSSELYIG